jgi:Ala-tRNA(Pro) deacylase
MSAHKRLNLEVLENSLKEKLKFANEDDLKNILGLTTGSVSPFGLINDQEHKVNIIIDKEILDIDKVAFHPNINTETLEISVKDFQKYINSLKNKSTTLVL